MAASYGSAVAAAMRSGNYVAAGGDAPAAYADLNETSRQDQARHAALLRRVDAEKRARRIVVPTGDNEVRAMLRKLGHPVRLFGESAADVRERLRSALARVEIEGEDRELVAALLAQPSVEELQPRAASVRRGKEEVYSAASRELVGARRALAPGTFDRARRRLAEQRLHRDDAAAADALNEAAAGTFAKLRSLALAQSQAADARPGGTHAGQYDGSSGRRYNFSEVCVLAAEVLEPRSAPQDCTGGRLGGAAREPAPGPRRRVPGMKRALWGALGASVELPTRSLAPASSLSCRPSPPTDAARQAQRGGARSRRRLVRHRLRRRRQGDSCFEGADS